MSQRLVNLDESGVLAEPIEVTLRGEKYLLPGDVPATLFVRLSAIQGESTTEAAVALHDELLALFQEHQPELDRIPLGMSELTGAIGYIYGGGAEAAAEEAGPTRPAKKSAAKKSSPKKRATRRSST